MPTIPLLALIGFLYQWPFDSFFDWFFSFFWLAFVAFFVVFFVVLAIIIYSICRAARTRSQIETRAYRPTRGERRILRESLPRECPECDAPLRYNEVRWVGPRQAECPYCRHIVELQLVEVAETN